QFLDTVLDLSRLIATELDHEQGLRCAGEGLHRVAQGEVAGRQLEQQVVQQFDRRGPELQARRQGVDRGPEAGELWYEQAAHARPWHQRQLCPGDQSQRSLAADEELMQASGRRAEVVKVVAADAAEDAGEAAANLVAVGTDNIPDVGVEGGLRRATAGALFPFVGSERAELGLAAIGENDIEAEDVIAGLAVDNGAGAGG